MTLRLILGTKRVLVRQFEPIWSWNEFVEGPRPLPFLFQGGRGCQCSPFIQSWLWIARGQSLHKLYGRWTVNNLTLQCSYWSSFFATLFRNFSSHVNVRRKIFVFSFIWESWVQILLLIQGVTQKFYKLNMYCFAQKVLFLFVRKISQGFQFFLQVSTWHSEVVELARSKYPNCWILSTLAYFIPVLTLASSSKFAYTQLNRCYWTLHRYGASHQCVLPKPNQSVNKKYRKTACFPSKQWFFRWKGVLPRTSFNFLETGFLLPWKRSFRWEPRAFWSLRTPKKTF